MKSLHPIHLHTLRKLFFKTALKYSQLKDSEMKNSQFVFHLDKLIQDVYIQKQESERTLTTSGKEFANRMDTQEIKLKLQPKTTTVTACTRKNSDGETEYLIYTRHKIPFMAAKVSLPTKSGMTKRLSMPHIRDSSKNADYVVRHSFLPYVITTSTILRTNCLKTKLCMRFVLHL